MSQVVLVVAVCVLAALACVNGDVMRLKMLPNTQSTGAVCLDGTPGGAISFVVFVVCCCEFLQYFLPLHHLGYYFAAGSGSGADKWILFFQGGGVCAVVQR